jgi:hypothetical protein
VWVRYKEGRRRRRRINTYKISVEKFTKKSTWVNQEVDDGVKF